MGGGRSKRRKTHLVEDQYGTNESSDRHGESHHHGRGGSSSAAAAGGGGGTMRGGSLEYVKHVPKFLQDHAHLLGHQAKPNDGTYSSISNIEQQQRGNGDDNDDDDDEQTAGLVQALEQHGPELLKEYPELQHIQQKKEAEILKGKGNAAFKEKRYKDAVDMFTRCIELDDGNHVYYSNRAAALIECQEYDQAIDSARACIRLNPRWAKGYVRLGIALLRIGKAESAHVLKKAKALEPDMHGIDELLCSAIDMVQEQKKMGGSGGGGGVTQSSHARLSFEDFEDEEDVV